MKISDNPSTESSLRYQTRWEQLKQEHANIVYAIIKESPSTSTLNLADRGLIALPDGPLSISEKMTLNLKGNKIRALKPGFKHFREIVWSHNGLDEWPVDLNFMPHLEKLDLSHNRLERVDIGAVFTMPKLLELHLESNFINPQQIQEDLLELIQDLDLLRRGFSFTLKEVKFYLTTEVLTTEVWIFQFPVLIQEKEPERIRLIRC